MRVRSVRGFRAPHLREHFVYRAYDCNGWLLYVGCTKQLRQRWEQHLAARIWASRARHFRVSGPYPYETARAIERQALRDENPLFGMTPAKKAHAAKTRKRPKCFVSFTPPGVQTARIEINNTRKAAA